jgi:hypothetical protein
LFPLRSLSRTSTSKIALALGVPALALAGIAASAGFETSAAAHQATVARAVSPAYPPVSAITFSATQRANPAGSSTLLARQGVALVRRHPLSRVKEIAWQMMQRRFGWRPRYQFRYLNWLWSRESSWNVYATNPYSGAYGIPQAVPGSKMASAGRNWRTSAWVQIRWGLRYIRARYGSPRRAWRHEAAYGWY